MDLRQAITTLDVHLSDKSDHLRHAWDVVHAVVLEVLKPSYNSVRDAICAFSGQCQYQNNGTAKTCKLPEHIHGCSHRQHP